MSTLDRRQWFGIMGAGLVAGVGSKPAAAETGKPRDPGGDKKHLELSDFEPKSMLKLPEHKVARARFPVIDVHTHLNAYDETKPAPPLQQRLDELQESIAFNQVDCALILTSYKVDAYRPSTR